MWLPGQQRRRVAGVGRRGDRARRPITCRSTCSRCIRTRRSRTTWRAPRWSQAPDDDAAAMYLAAMERLDAAGYEQYEISNVARPGRRSRHNLKYWQRRRVARVRLRRPLDVGGRAVEECRRHRGLHRADRAWRRRSAIDVRRLTAGERLGDALFTGFGLTDGVNLDEIRSPLRRGRLAARTAPSCEPFVESGLSRCGMATGCG